MAFGLCDFAAGLGSRRWSFWWVSLVSLVASVVGAWAVVLLMGDRASATAVGWGLMAGLGAAVGSCALYRGYGRGQMAVAGPLSAVGAAALPTLAGVALGERLPLAGVVGVVLAMPAIWLISGAGTGASGARAGVVDGLVSGVGFALEFVSLERAGTGSGLWPVAVSQATALLLVTAVVLVVRPAVRPVRGVTVPATWAAVAGVLSLVATASYFLATQRGLLTVAAVLASLYPAVTIALAAAFLHERPSRWQSLGLAMAGVAVVLIVTA